MSLRALCVNVLTVVVLALVLAGCSGSPTGNVVVTQEPEGPKNVVVTSRPAEATAVPVAQEVVSPAPTQWVPENVLPRDEPEVIVIPESKPVEDPAQKCLDDCVKSCATSAKLACGSNSGAECKSRCGSIIDPSACSTACSLRSAHACEPKFNDYCAATCKTRCY
jgi:hypothetical protein